MNFSYFPSLLFTNRIPLSLHLLSPWRWANPNIPRRLIYGLWILRLAGVRMSRNDVKPRFYYLFSLCRSLDFSVVVSDCAVNERLAWGASVALELFTVTVFAVGSVSNALAEGYGIKSGLR